MDFRDLSYVTAIAHHQSISRAARALYISQPSLTKFLQKLESDLGQPLFKRVGNRFLLTYAGQKYVEAAARIMDIKTQLDRQLHDIAGELVGEITVAFPLLRGTYTLPKVLPAFRELYPKVKVNVRELDSKLLEEKVLCGEVDLSFFNLPIEHDSLEYEKICDEERVLIVSKDHPLAGEGIARKGCKYPWIDIRRFENDGFILMEQNQRSQMIAEQIFQTYHMRPPTALTLRNLNTGIQLAAVGFGVCFTLETHIKHLPLDPKPVCFSIGEPCISSAAIAAYRKNIYQPQYTRDFIRLVKEFTG